MQRLWPHNAAHDLFWPPISQQGSHNIWASRAQRLRKENLPDSATSSSGPSPPPAAAGASGSRMTGSLAPGSKVCEPSSSDGKPCCVWRLQMIGWSLPLLLVCRHAESRLRGESKSDLQKYKCNQNYPPNVNLGGETKRQKLRIIHCLPSSWSSLDCSGLEDHLLTEPDVKFHSTQSD